MPEPTLQLGEPADESDWRALVEQGLRGAQWQRLVGKTGDGIPIEPLYREPDIHTATDISGSVGAAPFIRGSQPRAWLIRQAYDHLEPAHVNQDILADLEGGVGGIELVIDPSGARGVALKSAADLDLALADVILEAAPISLDAGAYGHEAAGWLEPKLKGVAAPGTAFNIDPIGAFLRDGALSEDALANAARFAVRVRKDLPNATTLRVDGRPVHEAGATEGQEVGAALASGIAYLRALDEAGMEIGDAAASLQCALSVGPDALIEAAKLRALRLCWARILEASGAPPEARAARIHAFTSRRMMTRYDAWTNILRISTAAFAAAVGGAEVITTRPFTDALGLPTPFALRLARNTQHVLLEECRLGHVADPAGGAWFVEKLTRDLAAKAWEIMQEIEAKGGIIASCQSGHLQALIAERRAEREQLIATRRETLTGLTDYPLLDAVVPEFIEKPALHPSGRRNTAAHVCEPLRPMRWSASFEALRDRAESQSPRPTVFCATLGVLAQFGPRAQFARNLLAIGGVALLGEEDAYASRDAMIDAFRATGARVTVICGTDAAYAEEAENAAQRLKAAGAHWVVLAGKPGEREGALRAAGVDQFIYIGINALGEMETMHAALGIAP